MLIVQWELPLHFPCWCVWIETVFKPTFANKSLLLCEQYFCWLIQNVAHSCVCVSAWGGADVPLLHSPVSLERSGKWQKWKNQVRLPYMSYLGTLAEPCNCCPCNWPMAPRPEATCSGHVRDRIRLTAENEHCCKTWPVCTVQTKSRLKWFIDLLKSHNELEIIELYFQDWSQQYSKQILYQTVPL